MKNFLKTLLGIFLLGLTVYSGFTFAKKYKRRLAKKYLPETGKPAYKESSQAGKNHLQPHASAASMDMSDVYGKSLARLTPRQNKIVQLLKEQKGVIEMHDLLRRIRGVTERTLRRDLLGLINRDLIIKGGSTKSAKYYLK